MPSLLRMKGLILSSRLRIISKPKNACLSAIDWSKHQHASLFELKTATDLAELLQIQGRVSEAHQHLSAAFDRNAGRNCIPHLQASPATPRRSATRHQGGRLKQTPSMVVRCLRSRVQPVRSMLVKHAFTVQCVFESLVAKSIKRRL
jgi:hypothetical protein